MPTSRGVPSLELQFREYQKRQRGEYCMAKYSQPRRALGTPYVRNRIVVVGSDFAELHAEQQPSADTPENSPAPLPAPAPKKKRASPADARRRRRETERRRLEWGMRDTQKRTLKHF